MLDAKNYQPDDIVRVTIVVEEDVDKNQIIENLKEIMKKEESFQVHAPNLSNTTFTIQIRYDKVEELNKIEGIKSATVTKKVELHTDSSNSEQTISQEIENPKQDFLNKPEIVLLGAITIGILVYAGLKKIKKD